MHQYETIAAESRNTNRGRTVHRGFGTPTLADDGGWPKKCDTIIMIFSLPNTPPPPPSPATLPSLFWHSYRQWQKLVHRARYALGRSSLSPHQQKPPLTTPQSCAFSGVTLYVTCMIARSNINVTSSWRFHTPASFRSIAWWLTAHRHIHTRLLWTLAAKWTIIFPPPPPPFHFVCVYFSQPKYAFAMLFAIDKYHPLAVTDGTPDGKRVQSPKATRAVWGGWQSRLGVMVVVGKSFILAKQCTLWCRWNFSPLASSSKTFRSHARRSFCYQTPRFFSVTLLCGHCVSWSEMPRGATTNASANLTYGTQTLIASCAAPVSVHSR